MSCSSSSSSSLDGVSESSGASKFLLRHKEKLKLNQYWYSVPTITAMVNDIQRYSKRAAFLSTPSIYFSLNDSTLQSNSKLFDYDEMWAKHAGFVKYDYKEVEKIPSELHHSFDFIVIDPPFITPEVWEKYVQAIKLLLVDGEEEVPFTEEEFKFLTAAAEQERVALTKQISSNQNNGGWIGSLSMFGQDNNESASTVAPLSTPGAASLVTASRLAEDGMYWVKCPRGKVMLTTIPEHRDFLHDRLGVHISRFRPSIPNLIYQYSLYVNYPSFAVAHFNSEIDGDTDPSQQLHSSKKGK